jgi:hypothetical protein
VQQLCEPEQRCCGQRDREFEIIDAEPASPIGGCNVSQRTRRQAAIRHELVYSDIGQYANFVGPAPKPSNSQPEAAGEYFGGVIYGWQAVEHRAEGVEDFVERSLEQLFFAVEVVIERAMPTSAAWVISSTGTLSLPTATKPCAALINAARVRCLRRCSRLASGCRSYVIALPVVPRYLASSA